MKLVQIGYGNMICPQRIIAVVIPESSPVKRLIQDARDRGTLIDASSGRKTRSVILMDSDHVILAACTPDELNGELKGEVNASVSDT